MRKFKIGKKSYSKLQSRATYDVNKSKTLVYPQLNYRCENYHGKG